MLVEPWKSYIVYIPVLVIHWYYMNVTFWPCNKVPSSQLIHNNDLQYCTCTKWQKNANLFDLQIHVILDLLCHPPDHPEAAQRTSLSHCGKKLVFWTQIFLRKGQTSLCLLYEHFDISTETFWYYVSAFCQISIWLFSEIWPISILSDYGRTKYLSLKFSSSKITWIFFHLALTICSAFLHILLTNMRAWSPGMIICSHIPLSTKKSKVSFWVANWHRMILDKVLLGSFQFLIRP